MQILTNYQIQVVRITEIRCQRGVHLDANSRNFHVFVGTLLRGP